jgi:hypothetical protein
MRSKRFLEFVGHFADFRTSVAEDGKQVVRDYRAVRAELHFPCEHTVNNPCQMEMQIYAEETLASTFRTTTTKPNLVFAILFEEDDKGSYFDQAFRLDGKEYFQKVLEKGYDPADPIKFSFMDALARGGLLPST